MLFRSERAARGEWKMARDLKSSLKDLLRFAIYWSIPAIAGGQNFFFDWNFLTVAFAQCGISEEERSKALHYTCFDTRSMAMQALLKPGEVYSPDEFSVRNGKLLSRLDIEPEPEVHEAINGARKAFEVYKKLREIEACPRV